MVMQIKEKDYGKCFQQRPLSVPEFQLYFAIHTKVKTMCPEGCWGQSKSDLISEGLSIHKPSSIFSLLLFALEKNERFSHITVWMNEKRIIIARLYGYVKLK